MKRECISTLVKVDNLVYEIYLLMKERVFSIIEADIEADIEAEKIVKSLFNLIENNQKIIHLKLLYQETKRITKTERPFQVLCKHKN